VKPGAGAVGEAATRADGRNEFAGGPRLRMTTD
jgi:hypothetical protein